MNALGIEDEYFYELMELVNEAEDSLLSLEHGYDDTLVSSVNRCLHSLKGNTGMIGLMDLEAYFHKAESIFINESKTKNIDIDKFLSIIDTSKSYFNNANEKMLKDSLTILGAKTDQNKNKPVVEKPKEDDKLVYLNVFHLDDEPDIFEVVQMILEEHNCKTHSFTKAEQMKDAIQKGNIPDLFIIDYKMPDQNGNSVLNGLNAILPKVPKIMLSAFLDKKVIFESVNRGVIGLLEKPIDSFYLEKILKKAKSIKVQNEINSKIYMLAMEYEHLPQDKVYKSLEDIKKLIKSNQKR